MITSENANINYHRINRLGSCFRMLFSIDFARNQYPPITYTHIKVASGSLRRRSFAFMFAVCSRE